LELANLVTVAVLRAVPPEKGEGLFSTRTVNKQIQRRQEWWPPLSNLGMGKACNSACHVES
jgi:hypothetical protein